MWYCSIETVVSLFRHRQCLFKYRTGRTNRGLRGRLLVYLSKRIHPGAQGGEPINLGRLGGWNSAQHCCCYLSKRRRILARPVLSAGVHWLLRVFVGKTVSIASWNPVTGIEDVQNAKLLRARPSLLIDGINYPSQSTIG